MNSWFPRPKTAQAIFSAGVSQEKMPPAAQIFEMMNAADAVEWRNRVGVTELENGATKTTTRLLRSGNFVFKTHTDSVSENADSLIAVSDVVARHFATVAAANGYWRD